MPEVPSFSILPIAIAAEVVSLLREAGFDASADPEFNPVRAPVIVPKQGDEGLVYTPDGKEQINPEGVAPEANVVCKCEKVLPFGPCSPHVCALTGQACGTGDRGRGCGGLPPWAAY